MSTAPKKLLSKELQRIFQLPSPEEVLAEYSSWLFRTTLLKGYLYLTTGHLCFHAFLNSPSIQQTSTKSGILTRRHSRKLNKVVKSWFILDQCILSWYPSSHQSYFPTGQIDLRFCTQILPASPHSKHPTQFKLVLSDGKSFTFRSDTMQSKNEWVLLLRQSILASCHDGRNVKIVIPLSAIDQVEKCDSIQFAQALRIKTKQTAPVRPFASDSQLSPLAPTPLDDGSLDDYFFGFLQDSQAPFDSINIALNLARSSSLVHHNLIRLTPQALHSSLHPIDHPSSLPRPVQDGSIRDSTRFTIPATLPTLAPSTRDHSAPLSTSQPQSGATTPSNPLYSSLDERTSYSKLSAKIHRIASSSHQFVGSPIRPAFPLVKVHHPTTSSTSHSIAPAQSSQQSQSAPIPTRSTTLPFDSPSGNSQRLEGNMDQSKPQPTRASSTRSISCLEPHNYPPKDRLQYSTCTNITSRERSPVSPQPSTSNSPIATPLELPEADSHKPWGLLRGWLKNVPITLNPIKPSNDPISQDPSDDESPREVHLTEKDELKFQVEFNFLKPSHPNCGSMRLLLKTKCNLVKAGSSTFGQIYLASPIQTQSVKQNQLQKSSVCFKGHKWMSSAMTKMILPVEDLTMIKSEGTKLHLITNQQHHLASLQPHELWFEFRSEDQLKTVHEELSKMIETNQQQSSHQGSSEEELGSSAESEEIDEEDQEDATIDHAQVSSQPIMFQSSSSSFLTFKPQSKLHITCLTIGSRGDVQPYIALCQKLQLDGHKCRIASHGEYRKWVEGYGIEYYEIGGDPAELMKICVDNGMFTLGFLKEAFSKFRGWLDELLLSSYEACVGTDLLIESPSTMAGIHIAEALQIPYYRAFTMPWTRTKEYPHAFAVPDRKMGSGYNYMTYTVFDQVFWKAMSGQVNKWRKEKLGLKSTTYEKLQVHKVPFLYNFSPTIVPCPLDWFEWIHVTGYWFIDEADPNKLSNKVGNSISSGEQQKASHTPCSVSTIFESSPPPIVVKPTPSWQAPDDLLQFLECAHAQKKKVVYIGFGSIVVPDPEGTIQVIIESIKTAGVYGIISKGWSERLSNSANKKPTKRAQTNGDQSQDPSKKEEDLSMIFHVDSIPHDWLFPRIDAVCHHGGAGTTGASLKAGIPTIIKPFFGDQFFWAERVETLGIGASVRKLTVKTLSQALINATTDDVQIKRAQSIGEQIRSECGAAKAVECIYRDLEYAKSLIKKIPKLSEETNHSNSSNTNPGMFSRPSRNPSYSTCRKSSTIVKPSGQSKSTEVGKVNNSDAPQTSSSSASNLDRPGGSNTTEKMNLMGSSLLILPPSNATTTTDTTITTATVTNTGTTSSGSSVDQESIITPEQDVIDHTGSSSSSPNRQTSSSSENFFDCDLENSKNLLVDAHKSNNQGEEESGGEENEQDSRKIKPKLSTTNTAKPKMSGQKTDNSTSDEDSSSWDILSQGSKSGPSSNELSSSFDRC